MPFNDGQPLPPPNPLGIERYRRYWYDGLGRLSGTTEWMAGSETVVERPLACRYDPLGRMHNPCENGAPLLGFDGANTVRTGHDTLDFRWTFVHGPGLDDPILGFKDDDPPRYIYYVTDGQGRQWAVGDSMGTNFSTEPSYQVGGKFAGGITQATSFDATRYQNPEMNGLSFFRNRFYDRATGRWTQEDPIGVAGGLNMYAYVGNNPASYTDPFGLFLPFIGAAAGFLAIGTAEVVAGASVLAALGTAATVMGATAVGSAAAAGVESLATGEPFLDAFERNYNIAGAFLALSVVGAATIGGGYAGAGVNGIQGYVKSNKSMPIFGRGGMTGGSGAGYAGLGKEVPSAFPAGTRIGASLAQHELGHTLQFIGLSAFGNPWVPYLGLGYAGIHARLGGWPVWHPGALWEEGASLLGSPF